MASVGIRSALNFKNFEEKKEIKLLHSNDVFIEEDSKSAEK